MVSFVIALVLLLVGYLVYSKVVERVFGADANRATPASRLADGVDYVKMPRWRIFLIQFLNIAGLGPIFGAVMGAMFGPASYLWIVFGCIFGGAVHDYLSGMLSLRCNGASLPEMVGNQLGRIVQYLMRVMTIVILLVIAAVFISGPADILTELVPFITKNWWIYIIFAYYMLATVLPIDKLIGKIYPVFGFLLLFMAFGILVAMLWKGVSIPEVTSGISSKHPGGFPIFPMMFVSIACGAVSGFHATQSPMMARCLVNEKDGRFCFYGAMVAEGIVALVWAAAASSFWGSTEGLNDFVTGLPAGTNAGAVVVTKICNSWLGRLGGVLAILGVVVAPITSGDTALRSSRLVIADTISYRQDKIYKRLLASLPIFVITFVLLQIDFQVLWRYTAWFNQTLAAITLWTVTVYLARNGKFFWISLVPAMFMTAVSSAYLFYAPECYICLPLNVTYVIAAVITCATVVAFVVFLRKNRSIEGSDGK